MVLQASANRGTPVTEDESSRFRFNAMLNIAPLSTRSPTIPKSSRTEMPAERLSTCENRQRQ